LKAGVGGPSVKVSDTSLDVWNRVLAINMTSVFLGTKSAEPLLLKTEGSNIVNITSLFATSGGFGECPAYHASKAGAYGLFVVFPPEYSSVLLF
jgi:NAD(P)-dependent dehydrogenase (short-subunit alcohol dehydrogenase family)